MSTDIREKILWEYVFKNPYIPHTPFPQQMEFLTIPDREALYGGAAGGGKAGALNTEIATPSGFTTIEQVKIGDYVLDDTGNPTLVLAKSEVMYGHDCYELVFDDGSRVVMDADHVWVTDTDNDRSNKRRVAKRNGEDLNFPLRFHDPETTITSKEIATTVKNRGRTEHSIPTTQKIGEHKQLPIDPYTLGFWLGDGCRSSGKIFTLDKEVVTLIRQSYDVNAHAKEGSYTVLGLRTKLKALGVYQNKHIPRIYLDSSIEQRRELFRGLMDSDGACDKGGKCAFTVTLERLFDDFRELGSSLGLKLSKNIGRAKLDGRDCGPKYTALFTPHFNVFHLFRKGQNLKPTQRTTTIQRYIVEVNKVDSVPVQCIQVAAKSGMFLVTRQFIQTHNSDSLLMAALMFVHCPGYNAIIFRKTYADLALPDAIMDRSKQWLMNTDAKWNGSDYRWTFPSGATLSFGYLASDKDKFRYQSAAFQFVGFDELTQFPEEHYLYLFSRLRNKNNLPVPLRMRGATNPGGQGHQWVFERFIVEGGKRFVPSLLKDNAHINTAEYERNLEELDETTKAQLMNGEWVVDQQGEPFSADFWRGKNRFLQSEATKRRVVARYISFDTALENKDHHAYTAYTVVDVDESFRLRVREVWRGRPIFPELPDLILDVSRKWNRDNLLKGVIIEGQASGKPAIQTLRAGSDRTIADLIIEFNPRGSKEERFSRAAVWCKRDMVLLPHPSPESSWLATFENEIYNVMSSKFKDQADSFAQVIIFLENYIKSGWRGAQAQRESISIDSRVQRAIKAENQPIRRRRR